MSFFQELKRRNAIRVAVAYGALAWLLIQVVETLFPVFGLPDAAIRIVVIVLAIGFVPAVVVAWAFEWTPDGLVRDSEVDRSSPAVQAGTRRLDRIVMAALALAVGFFAFDKFVLDPARDQALAEAARQEGRAEAIESKRESGPPVVAVLPFSAVTANEDSEFFAAGVHDDLLTKLAQVSSLLVISRTSVMEYKGVQRNIREIGRALGADAILEGGVQSAGNRIRINAQLIDAETDEHLWAETYDRELTATDLFDVQDDIARAIAGALPGALAAPVADSPMPTQNMAAYRAYHEALRVVETTHGGRTTEEYRTLLRRAVDLDPGFTRPLALLVGSYSFSVFGGRHPELVNTAEELLDELKAIAPDSVDYQFAQIFYTYYVLRDYDLAHQLATSTLERVPSDTDIVAIKSWIERRQGDFEARIETARRARTLEPNNTDWARSIIGNLVLLHRYDEAMAELDDFDGLDAEMEFLRARIRVREHGDLRRLAQEAVAIHEKYDDETSARDRIFAHVMNRDYEAARRIVEKIPDGEATPMGLSNKQFDQLLNAHFLGDQNRVAELSALARDNLAQRGEPFEEITDFAAITLAVLEALEGDAAGAERYLRQYYRGSGTDWAYRAYNRDFTCQILGVAGAAEAAVRCLREGLAEPSLVMPFIEPYLPFYDPVREAPVFVEWVEELERS